MTRRILITGQAVSGKGRRALLTCDQARRPNVIVFRYRVAEPAKLRENICCNVKTALVNEVKLVYAR